MPCYLVRAGDTEKVKIGWAHGVQNRVRQLQAGCWEPLYLLRTWDGEQPAEAWLHRRFSHFHIVREWFEFTPEMLSVEPPEHVKIAKGGVVGDAVSIKRIVETFGGNARLGRAIGVSTTAVWFWLHYGIPVNRVPAIIVAAAQLDPPINLEPNDFLAASFASVTEVAA